MKPMSRQLVAAIGALVAFAIVVPSAASAGDTALCQVHEDPCSEESQISELHLVADDVEFTNPTEAYDYDCDALITATASALSAPQELQGSIVYNCSQGCTRSEVSSGGSFLVLRTADEVAKVEAIGFEFLVHCSSGVNCEYAMEELVGHMFGPLPAGGTGQLIYNEAELTTGEGLLCPTEVRLSGVFEPLSAAYVKS